MTGRREDHRGGEGREGREKRWQLDRYVDYRKEGGSRMSHTASEISVSMCATLNLVLRGNPEIESV
jgi:hypothetical protein